MIIFYLTSSISFAVPNDLDSNASNEWTDPYLLEKFANHEARPNNLVLKPLSGTLPHAVGGSGGSILRSMTTTSSGSGLSHLGSLQHHPQQPQHAVTTKTGPYFHTGTYHPTTTTSTGRDSATATTNLVVQNGDLDINVNVIKNMLLANRVPESCV